MITSKDDRMLEFLWFVGFCQEFPTQLASRLDGHPDWNRHVMYHAVQRGLVTISRGRNRQRVIRSLKLTDEGLNYIGANDPKALSYILAKQDEGLTGHASIERTLRLHSLAYGLVMAYKAGAIILPDQKPTLMSLKYAGSNAIRVDPHMSYYYSVSEIRRSIQEHDPNTVAKGSRILGIIVHGRRCYCLYHTRHTRMYWMASTEHNTQAAIEQMLKVRGFHCESFSQVIIGSTMSVAEKIGKHAVNERSRYFTVSDIYDNCYFVVNSAQGEKLLSIIIDPEKSQKANLAALKGFNPPSSPTREYDAVTPDGQRPVVLCYQCDLLSLLNLNPSPRGFEQSPILLCLDYQADSIQTIVGPSIEVRSINGGDEYEKESGRHR